jgi:type II secretory pathway component PulK
MKIHRNILDSAAGSRPGRRGSAAKPLASRGRAGLAAKHISRRGAIVLLSIFMMGVSSLLVSAQFLEDVTDHYLAVRAQADGFRSRELAIAGFQASITALKTIPEDFLYQKGVILKSGNQPDIELAKDCLDEDETDCYYFMVGFRLQPEDGKLNLNSLVRYDDQPNENYRQVVRRLFRSLKIDGENSDPIVDWIDETTTAKRPEPRTTITRVLSRRAK